MKSARTMLARLLCSMVVGLAGVNGTLAHEHHEANTGAIQSLDVYSDSGKQYLLLGETEKDRPRLFCLCSADDGATWSKPMRVDAGMPAAHGLMRGDDAQIAAAENRLVAVWETAGTGKWGDGPMATALSSDGGQTWRAGPNPADDKLTSGHGFIDVAADPQGSFHLIWLDNRSGKQGLRYARSDDAGEHWATNTTIDPETCECCWNVIKAAKDSKVFALYRDIDPRDMALAISLDNGKTWRRESTIIPFDWHINACPEVGGGLVFGNTVLHAVVWAGKEDVAGLYAVASFDGGTHWSKPHQLGDREARHADIAANGDTIAVAWDALTKGIFTAISNNGWQTWTTSKLVEARSNASHPRILTTTTGFRIFWTETVDGKTAWRSSSIITSR